MSDENILSDIKNSQENHFNFYKFLKESLMNVLSMKKVPSSMEKEIYQQPEILELILKSYIAENNYVVLNAPAKVDRILLIASGSSYHCARFAADVFGEIAEIEARAIYSSEFLLKKVVPHEKDVLYVFITQSGETSDILSALDKAKQLNVNTMCITNKENSTAWNTADYRINCHAGEEKSIASTKALTAQMICLYLLALKYAQLKNMDVTAEFESLKSLPKIIRDSLALEGKIKPFARFLSKYKDIVIAADGVSYALAKEACLKIKETSYINVVSHILGEFMHGHLAVLNNKKSIILYVSSEELAYSTIKNLEKIKRDYNPPICIIGTSSDRIKTTFNIDLKVQDKILKMFSNLIIIQLLALKIAERLNKNIDKPKGLKKIVTEI